MDVYRLGHHFEAANKALAKEKSSQQVAYQELRPTHESNAALTRDMQVVQALTATLIEDLKVAWAFTTVANQEISSNLAVLKRDAQDKLEALGEEKRLQEQVLESTRKMLSEHDYCSSTVISLVVAHVVELLKSHVPDLDPELLRRDYPFKEDEEQDTLIDSVYETAQSDEGSLGAHS
jgi:flagellar biosynthesis/type III secretory pathway protein FliH